MSAPLTPTSASPVVFERGGGIFANSNDVAAFFGKRHTHVLVAIDNLLLGDKAQNSALSRMLVEQVADRAHGGRPLRSFDMTKDGFALVAMGFTGTKALDFKLRYIAEFNRMDLALRQPSEPTRLLEDPVALRQALLALADRAIASDAKMAELAPAAAALDRLAASAGSVCITDAAKTLGMPPRALFTYLREQGWTYRRADGDHDVAYQAKIDGGLLEHKMGTVRLPGGRDRAYDQVRVTTKGIAHLAKLLAPNDGASS